MSYAVSIERSAQRSLARIAAPYQARIIDVIGRLSDEPRPTGARKLTNRPAWRIRVGDYRIIYEIDDPQSVVVVVVVSHRREAYRRR